MGSLKILVPTDFSAQAEFAYHLVKSLGEKFDLDLHFLHVLTVPDTVSLDAQGSIQTCGEIDSQYVARQKKWAESKLAVIKSAYGNHVHTHLVLGKVTDAILNFSNDTSFDLIVMGTKGAHGLKEKLSGSEAQIIARRSKMPVLSLMSDQPGLNLQHILFVHNFNKPEKEELSLMKKLMRAFGSKLHFLQIVTGSINEEKPGVEANMKAFSALNDIPDYTCHVINDKDVEKGVMHFTHLNDMDIVCIGTHGKGGLIHHSATEKLINHLFKPIISFHLNH